MVSRRGNGPRVFGIDVNKWAGRLVINVVAIYVATLVVDGIRIDSVQGALLAGAMFGLVNSFIKPVVKRLTCWIYLLTLGLFALVVNAAMLGLAAWLSGQIADGFHVDGFVAAVEGGLITAIVSFFVSLVL